VRRIGGDCSVAVVKGRLGAWDLLRVYARLLFLQGLLNWRGMQNLGLASALGPVSGKFSGDGDNSLLRKHLSFFNCNPNFVPLIVGGVLRLEEDKRSGKPIGDDDIERFKKSLAGPLAAMGDMLIMGNLKSLALTFACVFAIYKLPIGLLAVLLLYNVSILACRLWGLCFGYAKGWELTAALSGPRFRNTLSVVEGANAAVGGVLVGAIVHGVQENGHTVSLLAAALAAITLYLLKRDIPASWVAIILLPICAFIALVTG
jgi:PTS system mannose-specific IID component